MRQATKKEIRDHFGGLNRQVRIDQSGNVEVKQDGIKWSNSRTVGRLDGFKFDEETNSVLDCN
jgi:hypothetical protein